MENCSFTRLKFLSKKHCHFLCLDYSNTGIAILDTRTTDVLRKIYNIWPARLPYLRMRPQSPAPIQQEVAVALDRPGFTYSSTYGRQWRHSRWVAGRRWRYFLLALNFVSGSEICWHYDIRPTFAAVRIKPRPKLDNGCWCLTPHKSWSFAPQLRSDTAWTFNKTPCTCQNLKSEGVGVKRYVSSSRYNDTSNEQAALSSHVGKQHLIWSNPSFDQTI